MKDKKILIAFLGNARYEETIYRIENKQYKNCLAFIPIYKHFSPIETVYIIGTEGSRWDLIKDFPHKPVKIPYGKSEAEFWEMFDILTKNIEIKDREVIFDITHCFRAIPIFTAIYIRFLKYIDPSAVFSHIFYGSFERGKNLTPIVDLAPLLDLLDWIEATISFMKYGEIEALAEKIKIVNNNLWKNSTTKPKRLGKFANRLNMLSNLSRLTYVPQIPDISKGISEFLSNEELQKEIQDFIKPFNLLAGELIKYTNRFIKSSIYQSHLEVAKYYLENKKPTQSLLVLRESILTFLCEKDGCDPYDIKARDKREKKLNEQRRESNDPIVKLWQKITEERNNVAHALMKREYKNISINKAIEKARTLLEQAEKMLEGIN